MQGHINELEQLHADLVAALDAGDADGVKTLVERRAAVVDALRAAFAAAPPKHREAIQPALAALLPLDRDLQCRAGTLRDNLRAELDRRPDTAGRAPRPAVTGVLDRQA